MKYEDYTSRVLEYSNALSYIADMETHELLFLSQGSMRANGIRKAEEYCGKKCYEVLFGSTHPCSFCPNSQLREGQTYQWQHYNEKLGKWFELRDTRIVVDDRPCHMQVANDITAYKQEREELAEKLAMDTQLMECLAILTTEEDLEAAMKSFLATIGGYYGANRSYIFEFDLEKQLLSNSFEWCKRGVEPRIESLQNLPLSHVADWVAKFDSWGEFYLNSMDEEEGSNTREARILRMQGVDRLMAAPLQVGGNIVGFLGVDEPTKNLSNLVLLRTTCEFVMVDLDRRRLAKDLGVALEKANIANQSKTAFLFNMSHDIRTPMNAILGFSMMAEKHINDKVRALDSLAKLNSAGKHLQRLINDVLDMSRIESGKMAFDLQPQHIPTLLKDTYEMFNPEMQKKDITFTVSWELEDEIALLDRLRMDQIELNLVSNALKYTPAGGKVDYTIRQIGKTADGKATYQGIVKDSGIGMSEEFAAKVFEPFEREKTSTVNGIQGTGLGMTITKSLIDQMGGTIVCRSKQGVGTEFIYTVTLQTVSEEALPKKVEALATKSSFTEKRILLVEDNELNREIAYEILEEFGFHMEAAEDGDIAVEMVKNSAPGHYDLILMDIQMPRMDGYTATKAIRALENKALAGIPIIAMTANAFAEDRQNAMAAGMNEHIGKPIDVPALIEVLQRIL